MFTARSVNRVIHDPGLWILAIFFTAQVIDDSSWRAKRQIWIWEDFYGLEIVEWAVHAGAGALHDVQVNHGGGDVGMTQEALDRSDIGAGFE